MRDSRVTGYYIVLLVGVFGASVGFGLSRLALAKMLRDDLGASVLVVSSLTTWFMLARAVASTLSGFLSQYSETAWRLLMSLPLPMVSLIVYVISGTDSIAAIIALNSAWGFMNGLLWPQAQAAASVLLRGLSGSGIALYFAVGTLGISLGQYLYAVTSLSNPDIVKTSSLAFLVASIPLISVAGRTTLTPKRVDRGGRVGLRGLRIGVVPAWIILAAYTTGYSGGILREFLYIYLGEVFNLGRTELGSILALSGVVGLIAGVLVGPASDKWGTTKMLALVLLMGFLGNLTLGLAHSPLQAFVGLTLAYSAGRSSMPLTRNLQAFNHPQALALLGLSNTLSNIGQMTGPLAAGKLYDTFHGKTLLGLPGEATPFIMAAILLAATLAVYKIKIAGPKGL